MHSIVKIAKLNNLFDWTRYVFNQERHKSEKIIEINSYEENLKTQLEHIEDYQSAKKDRRGKRPRLLTLILSYPDNTTIDELIGEHKRVLSEFYKFVSNENSLGLNDEDIKKIIASMPSVIHYGKRASGHSHNLLNRVIWNRTEGRFVNVNLSQKKYLNKLRRLSGWQDAVRQNKSKSKSEYGYKIDALSQELNRYRNINEKLDAFIALAEKDFKSGKTKKAMSKLQKIKQKMNP
jgi:predicted Zn-dependent protease